MASLHHLLGNTFYLQTATALIGVYQLNADECVLIDSGWHSDEREIAEVLANRGWRVAGILNTHSHLDHCGNNKFFQQTQGSLLAMSEEEAFMCRNASAVKLHMPYHTVQEIERDHQHLIFSVDRTIQPGQEEIDFCGAKFEIFPTPGHSLNQLCYKTPDDVWMVGDSLVTIEDLMKMKIPYAYVLSQDLASKKSMVDLEGAYFLMSHHGYVTGRELPRLVDLNVSYYFARSQRILGIIQDGTTIAQAELDIAKELKIKHRHAENVLLVSRMVSSYVEFLLDNGQLAAKVEDGILRFYKT